MGPRATFVKRTTNTAIEKKKAEVAPSFRTEPKLSMEMHEDLIVSQPSSSRYASADSSNLEFSKRRAKGCNGKLNSKGDVHQEYESKSSKDVYSVSSKSQSEERDRLDA